MVVAEVEVVLRTTVIVFGSELFSGLEKEVQQPSGSEEKGLDTVVLVALGRRALGFTDRKVKKSEAVKFSFKCSHREN